MRIKPPRQPSPIKMYVLVEGRLVEVLALQACTYRALHMYGAAGKRGEAQSGVLLLTNGLKTFFADFFSEGFFRQKTGFFFSFHFTALQLFLKLTYRIL